MAALNVESLTKSFGSVVALDNITLRIESGEFVTLLGPSGCGKTTFLRLVAGLEQPDQGKIYLDGKCINNIPLNHREMGMVVQNYALFPHMNVFNNVAYGLRVRKVPSEEIRRRVTEALELVRLAGFDQRFPNQLSGGQQQRCAIARALVVQPRVLLLDEALGALDKNLREEMQVELKELQKRLQVTALHVTHDQEEALGMSDRIVVLNQGRVEQFGSPTELYEDPRTEFVAGFIGDANIFHAHVNAMKDKHRFTVLSEEGIQMIITSTDGELPVDTDIVIVLRPERMAIKESRSDDAVNAFEGSVETIIYHGNAAKIVVHLDNDRRVLVYEAGGSDLSGGNQLQSGQRVWVTWPPSAARIVRSQAK